MTTTRWTPDTCKCTVEYEWDRDLPAEQRTHVYKTTVKNCPEHSGLTGGRLYNTLTDENTRKNKLLSKVLDEVPEIRQDVFIERTEATKRELKPSVKFDYFFEGQDDKRVLKVKFIDIPTGQDKTITLQEMTKIQQYIIDELGGSEKVEFI